MHNVLKPIVRLSAFLGKEIREIVRQPWLVVRLILGPFLILLLVGLGYNGQARVMRAIFVVPADEPQVAPQIEEYAKNLGPQLEYMGQTVSRGRGAAKAAHRTGGPCGDLPATCLSDRQEWLAGDPGAIPQRDRSDAGRVRGPVGPCLCSRDQPSYPAAVCGRGEEESGDAKDNLQEARTAAESARSAAAAGDNARAQEELARANSSLDQATALLGATALIMGGMGQGLGQARSRRRAAGVPQAPTTSRRSIPGLRR